LADAPAGPRAGYRIFETENFLKELARLSNKERIRVGRKLDDLIYPALREEPHAGPNIRKLHDWKPETWRYRIGPWRCFYEINESAHIVNMIVFERRNERIYR